MGLFKSRKLEVDILTAFLLLISVTSAIIITFTYARNYRSILQFSRRTIDLVSDLIVERIECLFSDLERTPELTVGIVKRSPKVSYSNVPLVSHFLDELKYRPTLYGLHAGAPDGSYIIALNMAIAGKPTFAKAVPSNAVFVVGVADASSKEAWHYYDDNQKWISSEEVVSNREFDPRKRSWYIGALKNQGLFWTDVYQYILTGKPGISVSMPVYSNSKELIAVVGGNLSLDSFSHFLTDQKIGFTGRAFVLDASGKIILPLQPTDHQEVVSVAYAQYLSEKKDNFTLDQDHKKYLISVKKFPAAFNRDWHIVIIVPFLDYFSEIIKTQHQVVIISIFILIIAGVLSIYFSKRISKPIVILADEVKRIQQLDLDSQVRVQSNIKEIILLDSSIAAMRSALRSFSCYVPKEIVRKLVQKGHDIVLGGEKREITLFFSDITDLTPIAESLPLETLNTLLAEYFDGLSKVLLKNLGTIDKYIGDGIMAFWDAPDDMRDHAERGCTAALECREFVDRFNRAQRDAGMPELKTRIGMNTGLVIAGNIGTPARMNYTVIGDVVNTTERLQQLNKIYGTKIIIGEEVVRRIGDQFVVRPLDIAEVKGRKGKIQIYELIATKREAKTEEVEFVAQFSKAYEAYHRGSLSESKALFIEIRNRFPHDRPTQLYLERLASP